MLNSFYIKIELQIPFFWIIKPDITFLKKLKILQSSTLIWSVILGKIIILISDGKPVTSNNEKENPVTIIEEIQQLNRNHTNKVSILTFAFSGMHIYKYSNYFKKMIIENNTESF